MSNLSLSLPEKTWVFVLLLGTRPSTARKKNSYVTEPLDDDDDYCY